MKKMAAAAMALMVFATSSAHAAVLQLSTSATDPNAGNSLSLNLNETGSMFVWVSTRGDQTIVGISMNIESSDLDVLQGTDHSTQNPSGRWAATPDEGTLGDLVTDAEAFSLPGINGDGINTADENTFVLHSEIQFEATSIGSTDLQITRGGNNIADGDGDIPDSDLTLGGGIVNVTAVPEPGSLGIVGIGLVASFVRRRRKA
ncbi:MAG: PEP-CTERM sorting domain-containing protein [Aureliella sp.]